MRVKSIVLVMMMLGSSMAIAFDNKPVLYCELMPLYSFSINNFDFDYPGGPNEVAVLTRYGTLVGGDQEFELQLSSNEGDKLTYSDSDYTIHIEQKGLLIKRYGATLVVTDIDGNKREKSMHCEG